MIGKLMRPSVTARPRKSPPRTIAIAADVAITVAVVAAHKAMVSEFQAAALNFGDSGPLKTSTYQRNDSPSHTVIEAEALNEYTVTMMSGA